jgi:hypothetical protein
MHNRLDELTIDHVYYDYGPGTHTTPYFERSLEESVPLIEATFDDPPAYPTTLTHYKTIETDYHVFGWDVSLDRNVREFSSLQNANGNGFEFVGSGSAVVTTPTRYLPFSWHEVTIETGSGTDVENIQANWLGKLTIPFEVGPDNQYDQYSPAEVQNPSTFHHVDVDID